VPFLNLAFLLVVDMVCACVRFFSLRHAHLPITTARPDLRSVQSLFFSLPFPLESTFLGIFSGRGEAPAAAMSAGHVCACVCVRASRKEGKKVGAGLHCVANRRNDDECVVYLKERTKQHGFLYLSCT
jgi:hypothetical protein